MQQTDRKYTKIIVSHYRVDMHSVKIDQFLKAGIAVLLAVLVFVLYSSIYERIVGVGDPPIPSSSLRCEMVGRLRAGSTASTPARLSLWTLSMSPTLLRALMAPSSSKRMSSSLRRFPASSQDALLAINWVLDSITVSMTLRLLA